jgi:hypothetical protein
VYFLWDKVLIGVLILRLNFLRGVLPSGIVSMGRKLILLVVIVSSVVLVAAGIYGYSMVSSELRSTTVAELLASPTQFQDQQVRVRGNLRVIYPSNESGDPQFFLDDNASSVRVGFPDSIWGSPPTVGLFVGKNVDVMGTVRLVTSGGEARALLEVQTMALIPGE